MIFLQVFTPTDEWATLLSASWCYIRELSRHRNANDNWRRV